MYFDMKNYLKNIRNHTVKHAPKKRMIIGHFRQQVHFHRRLLVIFLNNKVL